MAAWWAAATALLVLTGAAGAAAEERPLLCFGNEPSWSVDLTQQGVARFAVPDGSSTEYGGSLARKEWLGESVWRGEPDGGGGALVVFLRDGECSDGMSDARHPVSARVSLPDGRFLAGCCRVPGQPALEGPTWRVEDLPGQDAGALAAARPALSVRFHGGRVEGFSGCNRFAGGYTLDGPRIRVGPLAGTMMMCDEPAMALENAFRSVLAGMLTFSIAEGRLTLTSESGATARLHEAPAPRLEGVVWEVTGYNNGRQAVVGPQLGTTLSLSFGDGVVTGSGGCNDFRAPYTRDGDRIAIGPVVATRKACPGEGVMEQERAFLAALAAAKVWTVRDDLLDMHFEGGETRALTARPR